LELVLIHGLQGPKQIHALNFIRMGLANATTPGVRKNAKFKSNWCFKQDTELKSLYTKVIGWLTGSKFGEYKTMCLFFGEKIARRLAKEEQFIAPVV
jgi:hypothetical protein